MRTWSLRFIRYLLNLALSTLHVLGVTASLAFKSRAALCFENLALQQQLGILQRSVKAAETYASRSTPLGLDLPNLERLAICVGDRQAGDRDRLAPEGLPSVLEWK